MQQRLIYNILFKSSLLVTLLCGTISQLQAQTILKVSKKKVMIDIGDLNMSVDDEFYVADSSGKKKGLIKISKINRNRAIGEIVKGKAQPDWTLITDEGDSGSGQVSSKGFKYGGMLGLNMNTVSVKLSTQTVALKGSGFYLGGVGHYSLNPDYSLIGEVGLDSLVAAGSAATAICGGGTNCTVNVQYLNTGGAIAMKFMRDSLYLGAGGNFLLALSKSSNILDAKNISTNQGLKFFVDYVVSVGKTKLPIEFNYFMYLTNSQVSVSQINLRLGYMF